MSANPVNENPSPGTAFNAGTSLARPVTRVYVSKQRQEQCSLWHVRQAVQTSKKHQQRELAEVSEQQPGALLLMVVYLLVILGGDLLQEVRHALPLWAAEATGLKEVHHILPGPMEHNAPCSRANNHTQNCWPCEQTMHQ